jgi:hypothetical protein
MSVPFRFAKSITPEGRKFRNAARQGANPGDLAAGIRTSWASHPAMLHYLSSVMT